MVRPTQIWYVSTRPSRVGRNVGRRCACLLLGLVATQGRPAFLALVSKPDAAGVAQEQSCATLQETQTGLVDLGGAAMPGTAHANRGTRRRKP